MLIPPPELAVLRTAAAEALRASGTPPDAIEALLETLSFIARLPTGREVYRPNLGTPNLIATYLRAKYGTKQRAAGVLFLDREFRLLAEDDFSPRAPMQAEGDRLIDAAVRRGADILVFRYFRVRKDLFEYSALEFTRHIQHVLRSHPRVRFLDYLLLTPERYMSAVSICRSVDSIGKD